MLCPYASAGRMLLTWYDVLGSPAEMRAVEDAVSRTAWLTDVPLEDC